MTKKIVSKDELMANYIANRTGGGTVKTFFRALLMMPVGWAKKAKYRVLGIKKFEESMYAPKDLVEWHENKAKGVMHVNRALKIATHFDAEIARRDLKKVFNSYDAHKAIDKAVDESKDYSQDADLALIQYRVRGGMRGN